MATEQQSANGGGVATSTDTLTITDNRTGHSYEIPIKDGTIRARCSLREIKVDDDDFGLMTYDPAFMNTASCRSAITYIDGDKGILRYRGYPIEQLAEKSTYLEVAYLLLDGELPTQAQLDDVDQRDHDPHVRPRERDHAGCEGFRYDAHPMGKARLAASARSRPSIPAAKQDQRRRGPPRADHPADREDADARGVVLPPHARAARTSIRTTTCSYLGNFLSMMFTHDRAAATSRDPRDRAGARRAVHPARRSRAELLDQRARVRSARRRSIRTRRSPPQPRRSTARCTAAPTRPCCACSRRSVAGRTSPPSSRA